MSNSEYDPRVVEAKSRRARAARFRLEHPLRVLARPKGARFYNFVLDAVDLSETGFCFKIPAGLVLPAFEGKVFDTTVDMECRLFDRPLHIAGVVMRTEVGRDGRIESIGAEILEIYERHLSIFRGGLARVGVLGKTEP